MKERGRQPPLAGSTSTCRRGNVADAREARALDGDSIADDIRSTEVPVCLSAASMCRSVDASLKRLPPPRSGGVSSVR